jgi:hypothetical protein
LNTLRPARDEVKTQQFSPKGNIKLQLIISITFEKIVDTYVGGIRISFVVSQDLSTAETVYILDLLKAHVITACTRSGK